MNEWIKISVAEQQSVVTFNTAGRNRRIDSLAYTDPSGSQSSEVLGRSNRYVLAVRLPVDCARAAGLKEGDTVEAEVTPVGEIKLTPAPAFDKPAFMARLRKLRAKMPMSANAERLKMNVAAI